MKDTSWNGELLGKLLNTDRSRIMRILHCAPIYEEIWTLMKREMCYGYLSERVVDVLIGLE